MPHDTRDAVVDYLRTWSDRSDLPASLLVRWIGISLSEFHDWKNRFGQVNEHNSWVPRDHWLTDDEKDRIRALARAHPLEGYRRLTFMTLDADVVACSPASVCRVLRNAGLLAGSSPASSKKGTGFVQPLTPRTHWRIDVSYLNIAGTFCFLCSVLDGFSRAVVHHEIREKMEESDVEVIVQRARERHPGVTPRIISDSGAQFLAKDFKEFIRVAGMTPVKASPDCPQPNGKIERWHRTLKGECVRVSVPLTLDEARRIVAEYTTHYNEVRLHSAIGCVTPKDKLEGRAEATFQERDRKPAAARGRRAAERQRAVPGESPTCPQGVPSERPAIDFEAVTAATTIAAVLGLLGVSATTARHRGPRPLHGSTSGTSRCLGANLEGNVFQCFKCGCSGNALDLWAKVTRQPPYDAAVDLCQRLGIALPLLLADPGAEKRNP